MACRCRLIHRAAGRTCGSRQRCASFFNKRKGRVSTGTMSASKSYRSSNPPLASGAGTHSLSSSQSSASDAEDQQRSSGEHWLHEASDAAVCAATAALSRAPLKVSSSFQRRATILVMFELIAPAEAMCYQQLLRSCHFWPPHPCARSLGSLCGVRPLYVLPDQAAPEPVGAVRHTLARFMCGCVTFASRNLAAAHARVFVGVKVQWRWAELIMNRVFWGYRCKARVRLTFIFISFAQRICMKQ